MKTADRIRYLSLLTMTAFLMNVIMPFFAIYNVQQAVAAEASLSQSGEMTSLFGEKVLICTPSGFKWVSWDNLLDGKEKVPEHSQYECALCYVSANSVKTTLPVLELVFNVQPDIVHSQYYITEFAATDQFTGHGFLTRAPPYIA